MGSTGMQANWLNFDLAAVRTVLAEKKWQMLVWVIIYYSLYSLVVIGDAITHQDTYENLQICCDIACLWWSSAPQASLRYQTYKTICLSFMPKFCLEGILCRGILCDHWAFRHDVHFETAFINTLSLDVNLFICMRLNFNVHTLC